MQIASASASVRPTRELKQGHCSSLGERAPSCRSIPATFPVTDVPPAAHTPTFHLPVPSTQQPEVSCEMGPVGFPISGGLCEPPGCRPAPPAPPQSLDCPSHVPSAGTSPSESTWLSPPPLRSSLKHHVSVGTCPPGALLCFLSTAVMTVCRALHQSVAP